MRLIQDILSQHQKKKQEKNDACNDLIARIDAALLDFEKIFSVKTVFIDSVEKELWEKRNSKVLEDSEIHKIQKLKKPVDIVS